MPRTPYVNASLMHEIRMVAQFVLVAVPALNKLAPRKERLSCSRCLRARREKPGTVVTISSGEAVCREHFA